MNKHYLGDGVYIEIIPGLNSYKLTTEDGISETNTIYLEPEVMNNLIEYVMRAEDKNNVKQ
jgi:hypothetical protein